MENGEWKMENGVEKHTADPPDLSSIFNFSFSEVSRCCEMNRTVEEKRLGQTFVFVVVPYIDPS